jgi:alkylated DNA repair dioxygenase AlkB
MNYDLFSSLRPDSSFVAHNNAEKVKGLKYIPNFLTEAEHTDIWSIIYSNPWLEDIKRRVQHFGWKYDYKSRAIDYSMYLGELPSWAKSIAHKIYSQKLMAAMPDQVIINEYKPGQGIAAHIDCEPCFGNTVISISLNSPVVMDLVNKQTKEKVEIFLEPRSLLLIADEARYNWTHGIAARKTDMYNGIRYDRQLRTSLTFRKVTFNKL